GQTRFALESALQANVASSSLEVQIEASRNLDVKFRSHGAVVMSRAAKLRAHIDAASFQGASAEMEGVENAARLFLASRVNADHHMTLELVSGAGSDFHRAHVRAQNQLPTL